MMKTPEVLNLWVDQEGSRFKDLLKKRGFLRTEDENLSDAIHAASKAWRETYLRGIHPELREWAERNVSTADTLEWRLGGWSGWKSYRPEGKTYTTFHDVIAAIDSPEAIIPTGHRDRIPETAKDISNILANSVAIIIRCRSSVAVLEGTHRISALAYAITHHLPVPDDIRVIETILPETERDLFELFCEDLPKAYGPYKTKH